VKIDAAIRQYYEKRFQGGKWLTSHGLFTVSAVTNLSRRLVSFVIPDQVGHLEGYAGIRKCLVQQSGLAEVRYWGEGVFRGVTTPVLTFVADNLHVGETTIIDQDGGSVRKHLRGTDLWSDSPASDLLNRLREGSGTLGNLVADPGVHTGNCARRLVFEAGACEGDCVPVLEGRQISRYACAKPNRVLRLDYEPLRGEYFTIRPEGKYAAARFVIRQTAAYPIVGPRRHATYFRNSLLALYSPADGRDVRFLVALLNSRLIRFIYVVEVRESRQKAFPQVKVQALRRLPIRDVDLSKQKEKAMHDRLVKLVDQMLILHEQLEVARTAHEKDVLRRRIEATDSEIDSTVYRLYELSEEDIRVVEGNTPTSSSRRTSP